MVGPRELFTLFMGTQISFASKGVAAVFLFEIASRGDPKKEKGLLNYGLACVIAYFAVTKQLPVFAEKLKFT